MKTIEEKAKAYDEALERAKKSYGNKIAEEIFPELKEDDAERIRKNCIHFLELQKQHHAATFEIEECIAWLKKQGKEEYGGLKSFKDEDVRKFMQYIEKQAKAYEFNLPNRSYDIYAFAKDLLVWLEKQGKNSTDKPRFSIGDWVVFTKYKSIYQVVKKENYEYTLRYILGGSLCLPFSNEELIREWTIQDAKDGDVLATSVGAFIYNGNNGGGSCPGSYCGINTLGRFQMGVEHHWTGKKVYPATKEQRDVLMKAMNDAGYEWNAEKKELKREKHKR